MTEHLIQDNRFWHELFCLKLRDNQLCKVIQSCSNYYLGQIFLKSVLEIKMDLILRKGELVAQSAKVQSQRYTTRRQYKVIECIQHVYNVYNVYKHKCISKPKSWQQVCVGVFLELYWSQTVRIEHLQVESCGLLCWNCFFFFDVILDTHVN